MKKFWFKGKGEEEMKRSTKIFTWLLFFATLFYGVFCTTKYLHRYEYPTHLVKLPFFQITIPSLNTPLPAGKDEFAVYLCFPKEGEYIEIYENGTHIGCEFGNPLITFKGDTKGLGVFKEQ